MNKKLVVIDMQNDFVTGALRNEDAIKIVPDVVEVVKNFKGDVIFTRDTHGENYLNTQEGAKLPVAHCIRNTDGWNIIPELEEFVKDNWINKPTFGSLELANTLLNEYKETNYSKDFEITLIGVCTDICVVSNALLLKAYMPEVTINVIERCCAGVTKESHKNAIETMKMCQINVV